MAGFDWNSFLKVAVPAAATGLSGFLGYKGAQGAAQTQANAGNAALDFEKQLFAQQQANLSPYLATGRASLNALMRGMGLQPFPSVGPGANGAPGAPYAQDSPFGSRLLGGISGQAPSALKSGLKSAGELAGTGAGIGGTVGGPVGAAVGAGAGAVAGTISSLVGRGRKEADQLVPVQNAVTAEIERIKKAVADGQQNGTLTKDQLQEAHDTVSGLLNEFGTFANKFGRAGPGGIKSLSVYNPDVDNWGKQLQGQGGDQQIKFANTAAPQAGADQTGADQGGPDFNYFNKPFTTADFVKDPGYDARLQEGQKQLDRFFASRGLASSGGAAKSAARYGQTFASNEFQNVYNRYQQDRANQFNRLATLAGIGQTGTSLSGSLANAEAQSGSNLMTGIGAAQAAGQVGEANALSGALVGGANLFNQSMQLKDIQNYLQQNKLPTNQPTTFTNPADLQEGDNF